MYCHLTWDSLRDGQEIVLTTKLPTPLQNANDYEIALLEVSMRNKFSNVPKENFLRFIHSEAGEVADELLEQQQYEDADSLGKALKLMIKNNKLDKLISLTRTGETLQWTLQPGMEIVMSPDMKALFGLSQYTRIRATATATREQKFHGVCNPYRDFRRIYLMSDIILPQGYIQGTLLPILGSFPIAATNGGGNDIATAHFSAPPYYIINTAGQLETIRVMMMDEQLQKLKSILPEPGSAYCLAHIRLRLKLPLPL